MCGATYAKSDLHYNVPAPPYKVGEVGSTNDLTSRLPTWQASRPSSLSVFLQLVTDWQGERVVVSLLGDVLPHISLHTGPIATNPGALECSRRALHGGAHLCKSAFPGPGTRVFVLLAPWGIHWTCAK